MTETLLLPAKRETTKPSEVCKDTAGSSDPGLSYPFKLSCVAYHMTALVHAQNCRIDKDGQPYIPLSMWSSNPVSRKYVTVTSFNLLTRDRGHVFSKMSCQEAQISTHVFRLEVFVVSLSTTSKLMFCPGAFSLMSLKELHKDNLLLKIECDNQQYDSFWPTVSTFTF